MSSGVRASRVFVMVVGSGLMCLVGAALAQQGPVAAMFSADQKRDASLADSFLTMEVPATNAASQPLRLYLSAGDLERAFDSPQFRPDAAVVPTNTDVQLRATAPATQQGLGERAQKWADGMRDLGRQIATRRRQGGTTPP